MRVGWDLSNSNSVEWLNIIPNLECVTYIHFIFISSSDSPIFLNILISKAVYDVCVCVCKIMLYALSLPWASWEKADSSRTNMIESRRKITPLTCPLHAILGELIAQPEECACLHACHPALSLRVAVKWFPFASRILTPWLSLGHGGIRWWLTRNCYEPPLVIFDVKNPEHLLSIPLHSRRPDARSANLVAL